MHALGLRACRGRGQRGVIVQVFPGDQDAGDDRAGREGASEPPRFPRPGWRRPAGFVIFMWFFSLFPAGL